jgi:hypothetical protein
VTVAEADAVTAAVAEQVTAEASGAADAVPQYAGVRPALVENADRRLLVVAFDGGRA